MRKVLKVNAVTLFSIVRDSWRKSFSLIFTSNALLFLLVTLKTIKRVYRIFLTQLWPFILLYGIICGVSGYKLASLSLLWSSFSYLNFLFLFFLLILIIRPSVLPKGYSYYRSYALQGALFILIIFLIHQVWIPIFWWILNPVFVFFMLFWFDTGKILPPLKGITKSLFLLVCALPLCLLYQIIFSIISSFFYQSFLAFVGSPIFVNLHVLMMLYGVIFNIGILLLIPIPLSFWVNIYVKMVYDEYQSYFG